MLKAILRRFICANATHNLLKLCVLTRQSYVMVSSHRLVQLPISYVVTLYHIVYCFHLQTNRYDTFAQREEIFPSN